MKLYWKLLFLVLIWCGFSYSFSFINILLGAIVSLICLYVFPQKQQRKPCQLKLLPFISLLGVIGVELVKSSLIVAWDIITPKHLSEPRFIFIDLDCRNDVERTFLANIISLTPGTLTIDLNEDKSKLKVHVMFSQDPQMVINFIKNKLEFKIMRVFKYADDK